MGYKDPGKQSEYARQWRAAHPDYQKEWRVKNPKYRGRPKINIPMSPWWVTFTVDTKEEQELLWRLLNKATRITAETTGYQQRPAGGMKVTGLPWWVQVKDTQC